MGDKKRRSFTIDRDVAGQLSNREEMNASAVVNELLRQYLAHGEAADAGLQMRKKEVEREIEELQTEKARIGSKIDRKERELEDIRRQIEERRESGLKHVTELAEKIQSGTFPMDNLAPDNPAVKNYAQKASMTPERFIDEVRDEL